MNRLMDAARGKVAQDDAAEQRIVDLLGVYRTVQRAMESIFAIDASRAYTGR